MSWVLGPSERAAYLCVARHWGSLLVTQTHTAMWESQQNDWSEPAFFCIGGIARSDDDQKSRVSPIQWLPSDTARPCCSTQRTDECHSLQTQSALEQPVSSGCASVLLERKPSDNQLVVMRS